MIVSVKKHGDLERKLNSRNKKVVSDAIISLRNEDPFKGDIGLLALPRLAGSRGWITQNLPVIL